MSNLSGKDWWRTNQAQYPNSREINDLDPGFQTQVEDFIGALRDAGAIVIVSSTRRNAIRAYLMHYSWRVAYGDIEPEDVPKRGGVDIEWDHGDLESSRNGAEEMVKLFGMAHIASLTSNHIRGKAIDMTISWRDALIIRRSGRIEAKIESGTRTGRNRELHEVAYSIFGVRKLLSDPPHWSQNGR
jgi:hypothetical protein